LDNDGFLSDPSVPYGKDVNPDLVTFEEIADRDCLILLGEPGMGKTTELSVERGRIERAIESSGDGLIWCDLGEYGNEGELARDLFECKEWETWRADGKILHLYLDSLDESRLSLPRVEDLILRRLRRLPSRDRLKLRIACRTGVWRQHFERGLRDLWPGDRMKLVELAPLRRRDATDYANQEGVGDVEEFFREVLRCNAAPLAAKPITLRFLVNLYRRDRRLPRTQADLYEQGCLALCEETSPRRRGLSVAAMLSPHQRLALAARIAAMTVFCGRGAIWLGPDMGDRPVGDLSVTMLSGGYEAAQGATFAITEGGAREVLGETGLFSARGTERQGWAHRTFAEYLTARYLVEHDLTIEQIEDLILHPHVPGRVVPQLHETAAWLAGSRPDVFRSILETDPGVLLHSDVDNASASDREDLVASLLKAADEMRIAEVGLLGRTEYRKLAHPQLADQIGPYLKDQSKGLVVRRMAIDLVEYCGLKEAQGATADIALDCSESLEIREQAAYAVARIGDEDTRERLRGLLAPDLHEDLKDDLKGCALRALWPGLITADELFSNITPPKRENYGGAYSGFLSRDLVQGLTPGDLPVALSWALSLGERRRLPYIFRRLVDDILRKAWDHLEDRGILQPFADLVWSRLRAYEPILDTLFRRDEFAHFGVDDGKRRRLLDALLPGAAQSIPQGYGSFFFATPPLIRSNDLPWLVERLDSEGQSSHRIILARMVNVALIQRGYLPGDLDAVFGAARRHPELAGELRDLTTAIALDSPEAKQHRLHSEPPKPQESPGDTPSNDLVPARLLEQLLSRFESGILDEWEKLTIVMTFERGSRENSDVWCTDLTAAPGWRNADTETRSRILAAACRYVRERRVAIGPWDGGEGSFQDVDVAGFKAL
jgi:hypothetical protein